MDDLGAKTWALCYSHLFYQYRQILYGFSQLPPTSTQRFVVISRVIRNTAEPPWDFISSSIPLTSQRIFIPYSRQAILYHQRDGMSKGQSHHAHIGAINKHRHKNQCSALHAFKLQIHTDPCYLTHPLQPALLPANRDRQLPVNWIVLPIALFLWKRQL